MYIHGILLNVKKQVAKKHILNLIWRGKEYICIEFCLLAYAWNVFGGINKEFDQWLPVRDGTRVKEMPSLFEAFEFWTKSKYKVKDNSKGENWNWKNWKITWRIFTFIKVFTGNRWGNSGNSVRLYFLDSKITADGDCSHEIKRRLLLGRRVMTNLDSILKSKDITLPTKVRLVKAMVFPSVMYGCESWTVKKAQHRRIDAFELWCSKERRFLRVPWTARRSNQSILKEISPEYSLEGLMLKLKL